MEDLTKPMSGYPIWVGPLILHINWAKSFLWASDHNEVRRTELIALCLIELDRKKAVSLTFGPLKIVCGIQVKSN